MLDLGDKSWAFRWKIIEERDDNILKVSANLYI